MRAGSLLSLAAAAVKNDGMTREIALVAAVILTVVFLAAVVVYLSEAHANRKSDRLGDRLNAISDPFHGRR